ncbi:MAG: GtrA family protein [Rhodospirillum sp.]|nr:GtrA family protein [Rhodospirillum sp.]MCF8488982.1 GtrA family protein [Rhodospirillum sp.]MCF8500023.1 GtrA family protein [Rhodospirillum sp.]
MDADVLYLGMRGGGLNPYTARALSVLADTTTTWSLNRSITFRGRCRDKGPIHEYFHYLSVNAMGGGLNYTVYSLVVWLLPPMAWTPLAALVCGSGRGWIVNYAMSHNFVFSKKRTDEKPQEG